MDISYFLGSMRKLYSQAEKMSTKVAAENIELRRLLNESAAKREVLAKNLEEARGREEKIMMEGEDYREMVR
jgi:hypothetical protein